jgi:hypothetical protein
MLVRPDDIPRSCRKKNPQAHAMLSLGRLAQMEPLNLDDANSKAPLDRVRGFCSAAIDTAKPSNTKGI